MAELLIVGCWRCLLVLACCHQFIFSVFSVHFFQFRAFYVFAAICLSLCWLLAFCLSFIEYSASMGRETADNKSIVVVVCCVYAVLESNRLRIRQLKVCTTQEIIVVLLKTV